MFLFSYSILFLSRTDKIRLSGRLVLLTQLPTISLRSSQWGHLQGGTSTSCSFSLLASKGGCLSWYNSLHQFSTVSLPFGVCLRPSRLYFSRIFVQVCNIPHSLYLRVSSTVIDWELPPHPQTVYLTPGILGTFVKDRLFIVRLFKTPTFANFLLTKLS